ncbi:hypothetical protein HBI75_088190 [Parastagonospora nodorum]|nr:hypothetical protein HBH50_097880 [Parastagonospora nodorum]KAH4090921.1 hypothetical protein HBH48_101650 [Parastagonospora nodorum]KAH5034961.1 hypothetical protein HBI75_088190 [Parastagonospora nodorum]KAH5675581.1 hypothetical protein HBI21_122220 [Parastagonospora nodorum]
MTRFTQSSRLTSPLCTILLLTTTSALPTITSRDSTALSANKAQSTIEWSTCPKEVGASLQCGNLSVPIDWDQPGGEHFTLGMVKLPAISSNSTKKIGSLFVNPGGPGGSAAEIVPFFGPGAPGFDETLRASFDIIGLDPRGVGLSNQIQCDMTIYAERVSLFPQTEEEYEKLVDKNRRLGESCRKLTGPLFEHLDTISAAKDHEAVRVALGDEPINFLGLSYGSQLGYTYADLFPNNVRTLALDGILQHSQSEATNSLIESSSYELVLNKFFDWAGKNESSKLKGQDVEALWKSLLEKATTTPIPASKCNGKNCYKDVNAEEIAFNAQQYLTFYGRNPNFGSTWSVLANALYNASNGDATSLSTVNSAQNVAFLGIACLDWTHNDNTLAAIRAKETQATEYSPLTRGASQSWILQHACLGWPVPIKNPPKKLDVKTKATILLANSVADPSCGLPWALGMMEELENRVLVTRDGAGHTSFLLGGETQKVISDYLVTGKAPKDGLVTKS